MRIIVRCLSLTLLAASALSLAAQAPRYKQMAEWKIGGVGGWDYLLCDAPAHRLYVTHGTEVDVVDTTTGKLVGTIGDLKGIHGVALDSDGKTGYISDGTGHAIVVFDRKTLAKLATIATPDASPDGITFDAKTHTVWASSGRSKTLVVVSTESRTLVKTVQLTGHPEAPTADGNGTIFVHYEDNNALVRVDAATFGITATWPLDGCKSPSGMGVDAVGMRIFSACDDKVMVITDGHTGKQLGKTTIGDGPDAAAYDAKLNLAYASANDGTLTVVDASKPGFPSQIVNTKKGARTMALDLEDGRVFVDTASFGAPEAATPGHRQRYTILPDSFSVLVFGK